MSEWVKCSDRLPEEDTFCLGVCDDEIIWTLHFDGGRFIEDLGTLDNLTITHWMPLPELPNE